MAETADTTDNKGDNKGRTLGSFTPRTAIVTGSDSAIGKASAVALAQAGMDVGVTWHEDEAGAEATAREAQDAGIGFRWTEAFFA